MKAAIVLLALFLLAANAVAIEKPEPVLPFDTQQLAMAFAVTQPTPPAAGECFDLWATANVRCSGDIRLFDQCVASLDGGEWQPRSENCKAYGADWTCLNNECVDFGSVLPDKMETITAVVVGIAVVGAIYFMFIKKKKGGGKK